MEIKVVLEISDIDTVLSLKEFGPDWIIDLLGEVGVGVDKASTSYPSSEINVITGRPMFLVGQDSREIGTKVPS